MKRISLILTLLLFSISAHGGTVKGEMKCAVKSNYVVINEEGVPKLFKGFADEFKVGDSLSFKFKVDNNFWFDLKDDKSDFSHFTFFERNQAKYSDFLGLQFESDYGSKITFRKNFINWDLILGNLILSRYYKNDWSGIFVSYNPLDMAAQVATLDCRMWNDGVDKFVDYSRKFIN